ncbi:DNA polymerase III subunit gamma/tau [Desulfuromonas sp. AOP6]|uniref:DNA polymerase III subunit gamma/tau n=1 Tax=Desulfuromonas sp. AOP6 TaxID=1566351 RepID=UPI00126BE1EE|nr:DNA polymerase III subunit gamma/tau [Desulfuromonas sp. AOP6]BCA80901.1 DNA polymerase III subunit gamma/tau [Desulfuromonas sp. AOP6]
MSYLVLARKWRPQSFSDLVGQEHVSRTLANAIHSGRVHHAFLFTGARGVGKTSAARILAKALNCAEGPTETPCNQCPSCVEITSGQGVDVLEIDGASNTGVDDIRALRENIRYLPSRSRYKIFIIDEVHMLSINAFNALLKTLEEPPEHAKFIFATTEPHKIPITILSRCQRFDFRKISQPKVAERLREIVDAEGIGMSDKALGLVARQGEGSMRDSLSALDQIVAFCGMEVADQDVLGILGMVDRRLLMDAVSGVLGRDGHRVLEVVRQVDNLGHSFRQFCQELVETLRSLVLIAVVEEPGELLQVTSSELQELRGLAGDCELEELQRILTILIRTEAELATAAYPKLILEMALVRLAHMPQVKSVAALVRKIEDLERLLASGLPQTPPRPTPEKPERPAPVPEELPKKAEAPAPQASAPGGWQGLVEHVRARRPLIATLLENGSLLRLELPVLEIGYVAASFMFEQVRDPETLEVITTLASEYFAQPVTIKLSPVAGEKKAPPSLVQERQAQESDRKNRLRNDALAHPMIKAAVEIFEGKVSEVKPIDKGFV